VTGTRERAERAVLVTGCSTGIGRCTALLLKARGYRVFATARDGDAVAALADAGLEALALDLARPDSVEAAVAAVLEATGGRLYGLFNNAGYGQPGAVEDLTREALAAQFDANLFGTVDLTARLIPVMRARGEGRIVMNSSVLGFVAMPLRGAYCASKHALEAVADTLRLELAGSGVHVSLVEPGPHGPAYAHMAARHRADGGEPPFTRPPEAVARCVVRALEARRPRTRYRVTVPAHALALLKRLLPDRMLDRVLRLGA
jgi:NAD(P)-dependent dehydrogenase (short-subunit alcohol dehydrogenase family)